VKQLDVLVNHDELLLAEAIGWLHDYRKCSDKILHSGGLPRTELRKKVPALAGVSLFISTLFPSEQIEQLLNCWKSKADDLNVSRLLQYLSRCHNTAHYDKQDPVGGAPDYPVVQISTPFGFASDIPIDLTTRLWNLPWQALASYSSRQRDSLRKDIAVLFSQTVADTRRPINEVDLWSWGLLVGALYKAALAGALLTDTAPPARDLRWRLLGIRVNGLDYFLNVVRIPDLLARQELLADSLNKVRDLLEVTYPLGSEVYRDENGSIYVVPDVADLLERTDNSGTSLRTLILQAFAQGTVKDKPNLQLGGEMIPRVELEQQPWWGQDPDYVDKTDSKRNSPLLGRPVHNEPPKIEHFLSQKAISSARPEQVRNFWQGGTVADICTVCGLRPQGPGKKAAVRNVCDICEERRADRSQKWATTQTDRTIWTDEVADTNGRLALIVGRFDLTHWLDGALVETLLLIAPHDPENTRRDPVTSKTPSFSRLRRIWETTRTFWREMQAEFLQRLSDDRRRLTIHLDDTPNLGPFHVYDLVIGPTDLSVVWVPPQDGRPGYLVSADNLGYIARQLGAEKSIYSDPATAAIFVEEYLGEQFVQNVRQPVLLNPDTSTGQGRANLIERTRIAKVDYQSNRYATAIPILAEPQIFMALVPADKSLEIIKRIKEKYEQEMGKVRNRLPLHLGCIYAHRHTPIRALLDAGRAMLGYQSRPQPWQVQSKTDLDPTDDGWPRRVALTLKWDDCCISLTPPTVMGDNETKDVWYPYWRVEDKPTDRKRWFVGPDGEHWVHLCELRKDDTIYFTSSTFDFEFLDTTARRFEIHYDKDGRRPRRTRPFYLEDLDRLEELWKHMKKMKKAQRHQVIHTIEATREAWSWYGPDRGRSTTDENKVFKQFVADTLAGARWPKEHRWSDIPEEWREKLIEAGVRGELADLTELHMEILKE